MAKIYGDGIHDDYAGIQELLDSGIPTVYLPVPKKYYVISKTLKINSNTTLKLDEKTRIRLADNANCHMIQNSDVYNWNENITIDGGIWDMNHKNQLPNPMHYPNAEGVMVTREYLLEKYNWTPQSGVIRPTYVGFALIFSRVRNFVFKNATIENPVTFGMELSFIEYFTIENIRFDYFEGSPKLWNMDGIHLDAACRFGKISNLQGACHDDLLALNTDDCVWGGPIENIEIDGIFAENCHSAIRFLTRGTPIRNISVKNVFGSYYAYTFMISKFVFVEGERGVLENISFENVYTSICEGTADVTGNRRAPIAIESALDIKNMVFRNIVRDEKRNFFPTITVAEDTNIDSLVLDGIHGRTPNGEKMPAMVSYGNIGRLEINNITGDQCEINGKVEKLIQK